MTDYNDNTTIIFDGKKIEISKDIEGIFQFLSYIDSEIKEVIFYNDNVIKVRNGLHEAYDIILYLKSLLDDNNIKIDDIELNYNPKEIIESLNFNPTVRVQMIVLFAYLETLLCINTAYKNNFSEKTKVINEITKNNDKIFKEFISEFIITERNEFYKNNKQYLENLTWKNLRKTRNLLTHFFSTYKFVTLVSQKNEEAIKGDEKIKETIKDHVSISPYELYMLLRNSTIMLLKKWSKQSNNKGFQDRIDAVKKIIKEEGPYIIDGSKFR